MKCYKGYEWVTFRPVEILPPSTMMPEPLNTDDETIDEQQSEFKDLNDTSKDNDDKELSAPEIIDYRITRLSKDWIQKVGTDDIGQQETRECLHQHVKQKFCHGSKAAKEMSIIDIHHSLIVRYSLESVCERRQLCWTFEPFVDHDDDDTTDNQVPYPHSHQPADDPWKIPVHQVRDLEVMIEQMTPSLPSSTPQQQPSTPLPPIKETDDDVVDEVDAVVIEEKPPTQRTVTFLTIDKHPLSQDSLNLVASKEEQALKRKYQEKIFQDQCMEVTVPGTVSIHSCHICAGVGRKRCLVCVGSGSTKCDICEGVGFYGIDHNKPAFTRTFSANSDNGNDYCWRCRGRGRLRCDGCSGVGMTACIGCAGSGQIKCYIKMIVTLTNHHNSVIIRDKYSNEIPFDQIKLTDGDLVLNEDGLDLHPTSSLFHNDLITGQSERLIRLHRRKYLGNCRLIWQRHRIKVIPVCRVHSSWHGNRFRFYVFGRKSQRRCFAIDYPQRCFCIPCCCFCCCTSCSSPCRIA
ncbi:hypothetical protein HUG17_7414 [Dermatophagoides farinae]|nr:hypothetical protein HUG17_7414 [Dermatophagoides farinae]